MPPSSSVPSPSARRRLSFTLSAVMIFIYAGFILLVAYNKPLLGRILVPGLSLGIVLGAGVIVSAWVLTFIYVSMVNRRS